MVDDHCEERYHGENTTLCYWHSDVREAGLGYHQLFRLLQIKHCALL
ncbi:hypothetical protein T11_6940 [Trichinella zimbabwensis]|uniref:Uncharacterized protein n=1 Tax=Trichinella zimbabwensis TaxID=268475 RepID=A0A0V1H372_9BILA|nr:hypothetical protein T11_6940 [Trichinella zimbabwensis]